MKYLMVVEVPEGSQHGVSDPEARGRVIAELPEGTHALDIQAFWSVTGDDGKFSGGAAGFKAEAADWEIRP